MSTIIIVVDKKELFNEMYNLRIRKGGRTMLIKVIYENEKFDMVKPSLLNQLILSKKIKKFYRSGQWADIETDQIRRLVAPFVGSERRLEQS